MPESMVAISPASIPTPFLSAPKHVEPGWIDLNNHMNLAYYQVLFDRHFDDVLAFAGFGSDYLERTSHSIFAAEAHVCYRREVKLEDPVVISWQLLGLDSKRMHFYSEMHHATEGWLAATSENLSLHIDMVARKVATFLPGSDAILQRIFAAHASLPRPALAGRRIAMPTRPA
jgi:acyl-CoA thioester hydrolase